MPSHFYLATLTVKRACPSIAKNFLQVSYNQKTAFVSQSAASAENARAAHYGIGTFFLGLTGLEQD